jgi:hypothetical protein
VKRWPYIVLVLILILGAVYVYRHRQDWGLVSPAGNGESGSAGLPSASPRPANIAWQPVDRTSDGFKVEMPSGISQIQVPAYNEHGSSEQVDMIYTYPDTETSYSVAWAADPPIERINSEVPARTLAMARDDAMERTQTTLVTESEISQQGFRARDFSARNLGGGVFNARMVLARKRLYMLTATFPSASARRDQDVSRFFNSFSVVAP